MQRLSDVSSATVLGPPPATQRTPANLPLRARGLRTATVGAATGTSWSRADENSLLTREHWGGDTGRHRRLGPLRLEFGKLPLAVVALSVEPFCFGLARVPTSAQTSYVGSQSTDLSPGGVERKSVLVLQSPDFKLVRFLESSDGVPMRQLRGAEIRGALELQTLHVVLILLPEFLELAEDAAVLHGRGEAATLLLDQQAENVLVLRTPLFYLCIMLRHELCPDVVEQAGTTLGGCLALDPLVRREAGMGRRRRRVCCGLGEAGTARPEE